MAKPEIRLKGFEGEWEASKIGDVASVVGGGTPSTSVDSLWNGDIQWFTPSEVGKTRYVSKSERTISKEGLDKSSAKIIPAYSILLSSRATVGESSINTCNCCTNQGFQSLIPKDIDLDFLYSLISTLKNDFIRESSGSTFLEISANKVRELDIFIPNNNEQEALGYYFKSLDSLLQSTTKKIESLKQMKQACLVSMFPQAGETTPRVRFKGFEGNWNYLPMSDIFMERHDISTIMDSLPQLSFTIEEGVIRPEDRKTNKRDFLIKDKSNKKYLVTRLDDIIYNPANVIYGAIHKNSLCDGVVSPIYKIFYTQQDPSFMECVVRRPEFIKEMTIYMEGTVQKLRTLKPEAFLKMSAYIAPSLEEQKKIGDYFRSLDKQISLQKQRLEKLKQIKAACLVG